MKHEEKKNKTLKLDRKRNLKTASTAGKTNTVTIQIKNNPVYTHTQES